MPCDGMDHSAYKHGPYVGEHLDRGGVDGIASLPAAIRLERAWSTPVARRRKRAGGHPGGKSSERMMPLMRSLCRYASLALLATGCATRLAYAETTSSPAGSVSDHAASRETAFDYSSWAADPTAVGGDLPPI